MKEIKYTILYCVFVRTFVVPFYYGLGTVINYSFGFGSAQVTVPVPVPHGKKLWCLRFRFHNTASPSLIWTYDYRWKWQKMNERKHIYHEYCKWWGRFTPPFPFPSALADCCEAKEQGIPDLSLWRVVRAYREKEVRIEERPKGDFVRQGIGRCWTTFWINCILIWLGRDYLPWWF